MLPLKNGFALSGKPVSMASYASLIDSELQTTFALAASSADLNCCRGSKTLMLDLLAEVAVEVVVFDAVAMLSNC